MLFNSYAFIFLFLPTVLLIFFGLRRYAHTLFPTLWLVVASLGFYAYWRSIYVPLLLGSIAFNYRAGLAISHHSVAQRSRARWLLGLTIAADLGLLGYFKYTDFLIGSVNALAGTQFPLQHILLPLAISFFTFNQIAYLVDVYKGYVYEYGFLNYCLFIVFFPHLIAGPIVHHRDIIPQFRNFNFSWQAACVPLGLTIFSVGLFKKVVFADNVAVYANAVFDAAGRQLPLTAVEAWMGALAYTLQLYFDFSGYSDMAVGGALFFGIRFPWNFDSPYKATSIIDFWKRWHISLSLFLRDYLYIPLGGNRRGSRRRAGNILTTMLLGGLWHGADWTFVLWGGLHGLYVIVNHAWQDLRRKLPLLGKPGPWERRAGQGVTFVAVVLGWVMFRSDNLATAANLYAGMLGFHGWSEGTMASPSILPNVSLQGPALEPFAWLGVLLAVCWFTPSLREHVDAYESGLRTRAWPPMWRPSRVWAVYAGFLAWIGIMFLARPTEFLYYQF